MSATERTVGRLKPRRSQRRIGWERICPEKPNEPIDSSRSLSLLLLWRSSFFFFFFIKTVKSIRREMIAARCDSGAFRQPQPVAATENAVNQWKSMWIYSKLAPPQQCGGTKKFNCSLGGAGSQAENSIVYKLRAGGRKKKRFQRNGRCVCHHSCALLTQFHMQRYFSAAVEQAVSRCQIWLRKQIRLGGGEEWRPLPPTPKPSQLT